MGAERRKATSATSAPAVAGGAAVRAAVGGAAVRTEVGTVVCGEHSAVTTLSAWVVAGIVSSEMTGVGVPLACWSPLGDGVAAIGPWLPEPVTDISIASSALENPAVATFVARSFNGSSIRTDTFSITVSHYKSDR
jgi:hypothetical protein